MRVLITADLHYNHPKSQPLAEELIDSINDAGGDVLLVVGDTAASDGDWLERCLSRFRFAGEKLFVAGNHELWTNGPDSFELFNHQLPRRVRGLGWRWLQDEPFIAGDATIVGSIGWYDYSLAQESLGIPQRFYEAKISPGAAEQLDEWSFLLDREDDVPPHAREVVARWNDGKFVKLKRSDATFTELLCDQLEAQLMARAGKRIIAAIHHLPFRELLPPPRTAQWDFAKAYLGSRRLGEVLLRCPAVTKVFCGHSHFPAEATVGHIRAVNIGSGYRDKTYKVLDV
ncbi:MAG TPA: metallophosphoesterase [Tepidisphaeraceae bacterium]|nr:metallophosphoesterase [Tepidisphaeraceae bacterium]